MTMELVQIEEAAAAQDFEFVVRQLIGGPGNFPEAALRQCQRHSAEVTPLLIRAIEEATARVRAGESSEESVHIFALYLLWEFRAQEAWPAILAAISLPGEGPFDLFGDSITEDLKSILAAFSGDNSEYLDALIANRDLNEYVRWEAAYAYRYLVRDNKLPREVAVERLRKHLRAAIDAQEPEMPGFLISVLCDLHPQEALLEIREAFDRDLVDEMMMDRDHFEEIFARGAEGSQQALSQLEPTQLPDTVEHLRDWYWFKPISEPPRNSFSRPQPSYFDDSIADDEDYAAVPSANATTIRNESPRVGRNDPCPCGSGKKYKKCCLRNEPLN